MNEHISPIKIALRIPGQWSHPQELVRRLPAGFRFAPDTMILPDGTEIEFGAVEADEQFAQIFRTSCRQPVPDEEMARIDDYKVNILLSGPGGSMPAASKMMQAAAAIVQAGGAGVFIDNSTVAHGGEQWLALTEDGGPDALSFAFVAIIGGKGDVWTMGMHVLGLRDVNMKRRDIEKYDFDIIDVIRYLASSEKPIDDGHILADLEGPRFQAFVQADDRSPTGTPMHNPFGRLKLVSMKDMAETN